MYSAFEELQNSLHNAIVEAKAPPHLVTVLVVLAGMRGPCNFGTLVAPMTRNPEHLTSGKVPSKVLAGA